MLKQLSVTNYALIEHIDVNFEKGLTIITGETGAGKSILLGALGLILGERADSSAMRDEGKKCIVEGHFEISSYSLNDFFSAHELDFEIITTLRREIAPGGKSRAFVNDTPVTLAVLRVLAEKLIDIHSQHETRLLVNPDFQLDMLDVYAENADLITAYRQGFREYGQLRTKRSAHAAQLESAALNQSFLEFQLNELQAAKLENPDELGILEAELTVLSNGETIKQNLCGACELLNNSEDNAVHQLQAVRNMLQKAASYYPAAADLLRRVEVSIIDLKDVAAECDSLDRSLDFDQEKLHNAQERSDLLNKLLSKHRVSDVGALIGIRNSTAAQLEQISGSDDELHQIDAAIMALEQKLNNIAGKLSAGREKAIPEIRDRVHELLGKLGMSHAELSIRLEESDHLKGSGRDNIHFLIRTNKGADFQPIDKVASGGELSRIMLCLKAVNAERNIMPTIIFDEIDTGISGEIASKTGDVLKRLGNTMQVISISHLPQIAGKGNAHFKVSKKVVGNHTLSHIAPLNKEERIREIASMISGAEVTEAALENARILLQD